MPRVSLECVVTRLRGCGGRIAARRGGVGAFACAAILCVSACTVKAPKDPLKSLAKPDQIPAVQVAAMEVLDADPSNEEYRRALRRIVIQPGWSIGLRREAWDRLAANDPAGLKEALALSLPKMEAFEWRREVCERIAAERWSDMTPTLVRALAVPLPLWIPKLEDRPEYIAIMALHGDRVSDVLYDLFLRADPIKESNLRARCWELLILTGQRERLAQLLADDSKATSDTLVIDLRASARDLGIMPSNREEILWIRSLRTPQQRAFWNEAAAAVAKMPESTRATLAPKDVPVAVAAARHQPSLLTASREDLLRDLSAVLSGPDTQRYTANFEGYGTKAAETIAAHAGSLSWGDLAVISLLREGLQVPQVRAHLFDFADRDLADRTTEYGGIIRLDPQGRFEVVEYPPRVRGSDVRFEASQEMFDAGYVGLTHFHYHAQAYENHRYCGPHLGDFTYADATGVNGLVMTFVSRDRMNADYYRRGRVVVDLGVIERPEG